MYSSIYKSRWRPAGCSLSVGFSQSDYGLTSSVEARQLHILAPKPLILGTNPDYYLQFLSFTPTLSSKDYIRKVRKLVFLSG